VGDWHLSKYAKYLQRISQLLENLNELHRYDALRDKLTGYEDEMDELRAEQAQMIDNFMASQIALRNKERHHEAGHSVERSKEQRNVEYMSIVRKRLER
jgi:hypothetical protein